MKQQTLVGLEQAEEFALTNLQVSFCTNDLDDTIQVVVGKRFASEWIPYADIPVVSGFQDARQRVFLTLIAHDSRA